MIDKIKQILHDLGLVYFPSLSIDNILDDDKPKNVEQVDNDKPKKRPVYFAGRPFVEDNDNQGADYAYRLLDKYNKSKTDDLTSFDLEAMKYHNLQVKRKEKRGAKLTEAKARLLKPLWFIGLSSAQAEREMIKKGYKKGYSARTIDDFFSAFSSALLSEKGLQVEKTTQK